MSIHVHFHCDLRLFILAFPRLNPMHFFFSEHEAMDLNIVLSMFLPKAAGAVCKRVLVSPSSLVALS
jgi:hypothetical protein